jgi:5,6-dimethylbenzimidazole synthase
MGPSALYVSKLLLLVALPFAADAIATPSRNFTPRKLASSSAAHTPSRLLLSKGDDSEVILSTKNREFGAEEQNILQDIMRARRDVRGNRFSSEPVKQEVLDKIFAAASCAPSVGFSQPWEFVMVNSPQTRRKIVNSFDRANGQAETEFLSDRQEMYAQLKLEGILEAPVNIAVFYRPSESGPVLGQTSMPEMGRYSVVCAIQNMWLMARALNVGLGWVSILDPNDVKAALNAPPDVELVAYLCLGYVKENMFLDEPELEKLKWGEKKGIEACIFNESYGSMEA